MNLKYRKKLSDAMVSLHKNPIFFYISFFVLTKMVNFCYNPILGERYDTGNRC